MNSGRISRIVFGVIFLIGFIAFSSMKNANSVYSDDFGKTEEPKVEVSQPAEPVQDIVEVVEATPEPTPEPTVDPNSPQGRALALGLPTPPDIDINSWE